MWRSAIATPRLPNTAMALRFFAPITAPLPAPPQWLRLLMMQASGTRFSPACPMAATQVSALVRRQMASLVARVPLPHRKSAFSRLT
ncbi:Uncharacterised protein [Edwardsiella tarda]|nr:Uncharacterised protein [Edwardsiella tarda]